MRLHEDQLAVDEETVRRLVSAQFPWWRGLPVREEPTAGTVNAVFRIGEGLAVHLPLRAQPPAAFVARLRAIDTRGRRFQRQAAAATCSTATGEPSFASSEGLLEVAPLRARVGAGTGVGAPAGS